MARTNHEKWANLFEREIHSPKSVEILEKIDVGYNSIVYLVSVNGRDYAVKIYSRRYNGTEVCFKERDHILRARESIADAVPEVIFCSGHRENEFDREILVMEKAMGVPLNRKVFNERFFKELINVLKRLHRTGADNSREIDEMERIQKCRKTILQFLEEDEIIAKERASNHLDALRSYYLQKKGIFNLGRTLTHGDLWWDNILVDDAKVRIVDWLESSEQDYCRDLAQLKIGTLDEILDGNRSQYFFEKILDAYKEEFQDETIFERMRYHVPMMYLEESFYLPFRFFPWQVKYQEDAEDFRKRFIHYFAKSESFLRYEQGSR